MRSRAVSLPPSCCFLIRSAPAALERARVHLVEALDGGGRGLRSGAGMGLPIAAAIGRTT